MSTRRRRRWCRACASTLAKLGAEGRDHVLDREAGRGVDRVDAPGRGGQAAVCSGSAHRGGCSPVWSCSRTEVRLPMISTVARTGCMRKGKRTAVLKQTARVTEDARSGRGRWRRARGRAGRGSARSRRRRPRPAASAGAGSPVSAGNGSSTRLVGDPRARARPPRSPRSPRRCGPSGRRCRCTGAPADRLARRPDERRGHVGRVLELVGAAERQLVRQPRGGVEHRGGRRGGEALVAARPVDGVRAQARRWRCPLLGREDASPCPRWRA